ncbi:MAG: type II CAAX endopeptidase family protein [Halobacteriales archaeon]|nr:type II CAAX endopeptidase family protein [Halobacteriales archaeon]
MDRAGIEDRLRALGIALGAALAGILSAVVLTLVAVLVVSGLGVGLGVIGSVLLTLALTAGVAFGGVSLAYVRYRGLGRSFIGVRLPTPRDLAWVGGGYLLAFLSVLVASVLVGLIGADPAPNQLSQAGLEEPALLLLLVPISLFLVGPGEELLFRGVVQGTLRRSFGPVGAVTIAAAIFASVHFVALTGGVSARLTTIAILFLPSLVFGAAYERTGNLAVSALIHGLYNSTLAVLLYVGLAYGSVPQGLVG